MLCVSLPAVNIPPFLDLKPFFLFSMAAMAPIGTADVNSGRRAAIDTPEHEPDGALSRFMRKLNTDERASTV